PHAALVARGRIAESEHLEEYLEETATALAPLLERASLFDRRVQREHDLVAAGERRLLRLGFGPHAGPLAHSGRLAPERASGSNVREHSQAGRVAVALRSRRTFVDLTVTDDGCGFDPRRLDTDRLGLAGISERVRLLGGAVEIETTPGAGTTVRATLPQWKPSTPAAATIYAATA